MQQVEPSLVGVSTPEPDYLERSFSALVQALDIVPAGQEADYLARLAIILAQEIQNPARFEKAIARALPTINGKHVQ